MARQLITPNPQIPCTPGLCLVYVREAFGIGQKYPSAIAGWNASTRKHADMQFPDDAWVPLWFSLSDNPYGHVALRQPDGGVWSASSPKETVPIHHASLDDLLSYYGGRLSYLGWTEDIEDVLVIDGEPSVRQLANPVARRVRIENPHAAIIRMRANRGIKLNQATIIAEYNKSQKHERLPKKGEWGKIFPQID